jgi:hypothetical protein
MTKYLLPLFALVIFLVPSEAGATAYYVDFTNGSDANTGLGTTSALAYRTINAFANVARAAGDIAFVRRGTASTTYGLATSFTTDGTLNNPIVLSADYDSLWPTDFANSAQTYTPVFGATTMTASANITGIAANDWVYVVGDCSERYGSLAAAPSSPTINNCAFAYEVATVSGTTLTLFLPYKGPTTGSGQTLRVMADVPLLGGTAGAPQIFAMSSDYYWIIKGFDIRSTSASCVASLTTSKGTVLTDLVIQTNGTTDCGIGNASFAEHISKVRFFGTSGAFTSSIKGADISDFYINCNSVASSFAFRISYAGAYSIKNGEIVNCTNTNGGIAAGDTGGIITYTNVKDKKVFSGVTGFSYQRHYFEDAFGTVGLSSQSSNQISLDTISTTTVSATDNLRAGGGPVNLKVFPPSGTGDTGISTKFFPASYMKLFEYPIYTDTSSKTYTMYFMATSSTAFNVAPFTDQQTGSSTPEMYIECEYYNESSGADRYLKHSNTASAFTADGTWYGISVTCQPTQSGILYLRGWYAKPKDGRSNWFYMDTTPVVS